MSQARVVIYLEHNSLSDGMQLRPLVAETLRCYVEMLENGTAGNSPHECFFCAEGMQVTIVVTSADATEIPHSLSLRPPRRVVTYKP